MFLHEAKRVFKYTGIRAGLELISGLQLQSLLPKAGGRGVIFTLHHVRPEPSTGDFLPNAILSVTPHFLEQAILTCLECGMTPVHLHDLPELLRDPADKRRFVAFTLDDGYRNNARYAAPIFNRLNIPYTIFVTKNFSLHQRSLWWEVSEALLRKVDQFAFDFGNGSERVETQSLRQKNAAFSRLARFVDETDENLAVIQIDQAAKNAGIDPLKLTETLIMDVTALQALAQNDPLVHLGAHSVNHLNLARLSATQQADEIGSSAAWLESVTGNVPKSFAFPYGWTTAVSEQVCTRAAEAGFDIAVTTQPGMLHRDRNDTPMAFPRVSLNGYFQEKRYVKALISGIPFLHK